MHDHRLSRLCGRFCQAPREKNRYFSTAPRIQDGRLHVGREKIAPFVPYVICSLTPSAASLSFPPLCARARARVRTRTQPHTHMRARVARAKEPCIFYCPFMSIFATFDTALRRDADFSYKPATSQLKNSRKVQSQAIKLPRYL